MTVDVVHGDCVDVLAGMDECSVDAVVTDPPYGLEFMGKDWDRLDAGLPQESVWKGRRGQGGSSIKDDDSRPSSRHGVAYGVKRHGFKRCTVCGRRAFSGSPCECDDPEWTIEHNQGPPSAAVRMQRWHEEWARAAYRVLKPGGHLLAFGGTRTYHRLACAVEDAGFEIRDTIAWLYGSGFPKSLNLDGEWDGWGTALKPAFEPIVVARKPLAGTVAANVLEHGTGALNIGAGRIPAGDDHREKCESVVGLGSNRNGNAYGEWTGERESSWTPAGRWPANVVLDEAAAAMLDHQTGELTSGTRAAGVRTGMGYHGANGDGGPAIQGNSGGASRFFYTAKASTTDRGPGNTHPTVKPVELMRWLIRLVTPPDGHVVDPFAGSGTTGVACVIENRRCTLIEREAEYVDIIERRLAQPIQPVLL